MSTFVTENVFHALKLSQKESLCVCCYCSYNQLLWLRETNKPVSHRHKGFLSYTQSVQQRTN